MKAIYDTTAFAMPARELPIAPDTEVREGQLLAMQNGLAVPAAANRTAAVLGVALESHSGEATLLDPRAAGNRIRVAAGPHTVYAAAAPVITATAGTAAGISASGLSAFANDDLNGWTLMLRSKTADSANPDPEGTVYAVTDFAAGGKTLTLEGLGGAPAAGDTFWAFPPFGPLKGLLNAGRDGLTLNGGTPVSLPLMAVGCDYERREVQLMPMLHEFATKRA